MKNILWVGSINWLDSCGKYVMQPKTAGAVSSSAFEQAIIEGIEEYDENSVQILTDTDNQWGCGFIWSHNGKSEDVCVSGISVKYLRLIYKSLILRREIAKNRDKYKAFNYVIVYSIHIPYVSIYRVFKRLNKDIKLVLICPDLSEYNDPAINNKPVKALLRKIESFYVHSQSKYIDGYILFSRKMKEYFQENIKYSVLEGVFYDNGLDLSPNDKRENYIMYAGSLSANFGLQNLIEAFKSINNNQIQLFIFGTGELRNYILEQEKEDQRIKYFGFVDRSTLFEYEKRAVLLVNTRNPDEAFTKYSFPSKTFEYMVSGTPFLTTKLTGIPDEYYEYLISIENNSPELIAKTISEYLTWPDSKKENFGKQAKEFIINNKNKQLQAKKILDFLNTI